MWKSDKPIRVAGFNYGTFKKLEVTDKGSGVRIEVYTNPGVPDIVKEIKRMIRGSKAVIADLSGSKPNVLYELGIAHALRRPTIHICSTPLSKLPFDVRNWRTLEYKRGQTHQLARILSKRLKVLLRRHT